MVEYESDMQALGAFRNALPLQQLEASLAQFNIFEALGITRRELHHSRFLAFLLDPRANHMLGDAFLRSFLRCALERAEKRDLGITQVDLDVVSLDRVSVRCESEYIDVLLEDQTNHLVVIVENKIDTSEHSDQLTRYLDSVERRHPGWIIVPIYLTPRGDEPSNTAYIGFDYTAVSELADALCNSHRAKMHPDVLTLTMHYVSLLRRHVVAETEIAALCAQLFKEHGKALDILFEHRPQQGASLAELVDREPDLILVRSTERFVRFTHRRLDIDALMGGSVGPWSGRRLVFEFKTEDGMRSCQLYLVLEPEPGPCRERLIGVARRSGPPFNVKLSQWASLYHRWIFRADDHISMSPDELEEHIGQQWNEFITEDMPRLVDALASEFGVSE